MIAVAVTPFLFRIAALAGLLLGLPLLGVALAGEPVDRYLEFPPTTRYVEHPGFSWLAFGILAAAGVALLGAFAWRLATVAPAAAPALRRRPFPWWGWLGLALTALAWAAAWTRLEPLETVQRHTFTPLWLGYAVSVNALAYSRSGRCLVVDRPLLFLALFPLSAAFWWFFEYLNRFVQNWYYVGVAELGPLDYFLSATVPFSTVLPAVLGTCDLLATFPRLAAALRGPELPARATSRAAGWALLAVAGAGLAGIGTWPSALFPLVWIAPLLVIAGVQLARGEATVLDDGVIARWPLLLPALAALVCGFFWEMWNYGSLAGWEYSVPYVHRYLLFEMPVLGYGGYLPFGLECVAVARLLPMWDRD